MAQLNSSFSRDDIEVLIDAMGDWESIGNHEYHVMQMVKGHPMPERDDESFDFIKRIKDHFKKREREIKDERSVRQEKAILVKAKLVLLRQEGGINKLLEVAASTIEDSDEPVRKEAGTALTEAEQNRLELAEYFINDMGVWGFYEKFLLERGVKAKLEDEPDSSPNGEESPANDEEDEWFHNESE